MRQLVFNPAVLPILIAIGIIALLLGCRIAAKGDNQFYLRRITVFLFLFTGLNLTIPPFVFLYPEALAGFDKTISSAILQFAVYSFFVLILSSWFSDFFESLLLLFKNPFLGLFLIFSVLSTAWSETPVLCLRSGLVLFFVSMLSAHMVKDLRWSELAKLLRLVTLVAALTSVISAAVAPSLAFGEKGLTGILPFPIRLGTCMALGIALWFSLLLDQRKNRLKTIGIILILLITLILTNSAQAIITCLTLVSLVGLLKVLKKMGRLAPILILLYCSITILLVVGLNTYIPLIFNLLGRDATLTGRTEFWPQLIERLLSQRPLLGYSLNGFWQAWRGSLNPANGILNASGFVPPNGHNGFLDLALCLGIIGLLLFSISFLAGFIQAIRHFAQRKSSDEILPILLLVYLVMANISETQLLGSNYIWILYVMTLVRLNIKPFRTIVDENVALRVTALYDDYAKFSSFNESN
ncbi:MAG: hypothetical protein C4288_13015 [Leptolyngbya sp. ERB_1_1]